MKRIVLFLFLTCTLYVTVFAQQSFYVSAKGNDNNDGLSEARSVMSLEEAYFRAMKGSIKKITVIGTLNENTESNSISNKYNAGSVFCLMNLGDTSQEITITGKLGATSTDNAVLSAKGSADAAVILVDSGVRVRFEHIEISGGEGEYGSGICIYKSINVTLGPGAVVRGNQSFGLHIAEV